MTQELSIVAAFILGLSSAPHCIGMCGGIAGAMNTSPDRPLYPRAVLWRYSLLQNTGRIFSYTLMGSAFAFLGAPIFGLEYANAARVVTGVIFIILGIHFAFDWQGIRRVERIGQPLWRLVAPHAKKLLPVGTSQGSFLLGMTWGLLPCGLVYTMLLLAASSMDVSQSAITMLAFGSGTLPAMFAFSWFSLGGRNWLRFRGWRRVVGLCTFFLGLWVIIQFIMTIYNGAHMHHLH
ncbi:MAG TPA: sulfite exporter TauE/SafE family protein [Gammaproteobacteria bacterium]